MKPNSFNKFPRQPIESSKLSEQLSKEKDIELLSSIKDVQEAEFDNESSQIFGPAMKYTTFFEEAHKTVVPGSPEAKVVDLAQSVLLKYLQSSALIDSHGKDHAAQKAWEKNIEDSENPNL